MGGHIHRSGADDETVLIRHTEEVVCDADGHVPKPKHHLTGIEMTPAAMEGYPIQAINLTTGTRTQLYKDESGSASSTDYVRIEGNKSIKFKNPSLIDDDHEEDTAPGDRIRLFWVEKVTQASSNSAVEVTISPETFPGTYRVVGDTFMRSQETGKDEAFQFVIERAKVLSDVTITLEAEGDPSTFEMSLSVLRASNERGDKEMMKLIRYAVEDTGSASSENDIGSLV